MNEMRERVADILAKQVGYTSLMALPAGGRDKFRDRAAEVIAAMREPTEEMVAVGCAVMDEEEGDLPTEVGVMAAFVAMIDPEDIRRTVVDMWLDIDRYSDRVAIRQDVANLIIAERKRHEQAYAALRKSNQCLRDVAMKVGPLHAFWDVIADNDAILAGVK